MCVKAYTRYLNMFVANVAIIICKFYVHYSLCRNLFVRIFAFYCYQNAIKYKLNDKLYCSLLFKFGV